ncbi:MAG: lysozyme inhibitor LprI family protein [Methylophilus sp.]|nr:lysozyme inhibitor LprI family protein [Methylophilus sp.]
MDLLVKIGLVLLGSLISVVAYFAIRLIEGKPQNETLERHKKLLEINKQLNEQGLDIEGLRNLETLLIGKTIAIKRHTSELTDKREPLIAVRGEEDITQLDLNQRASERFDLASQKMYDVIASIDGRVGDTESQALMKSQTAWEGYSVDQAMAAASSYAGGSMWSLVYFSELESLTIERTARLQAELDELIRLAN